VAPLDAEIALKAGQRLVGGRRPVGRRRVLLVKAIGKIYT
jgi:hypothetical protein